MNIEPPNMKNQIVLLLILLGHIGCDSAANKPTSTSNATSQNNTQSEKVEKYDWESRPGFAKPYVSGDFWIMEYSPDDFRVITPFVGDNKIGMIQQAKIGKNYITTGINVDLSDFIDVGYYDEDKDGHFELLIVEASKTSPNMKVYTIDKEGNIAPASQEKVDEINAIGEAFTEFFQEKAPAAKTDADIEKAFDETNEKLKKILEK